VVCHSTVIVVFVPSKMRYGLFSTPARAAVVVRK